MASPAEEGSCRSSEQLNEVTIPAMFDKGRLRTRPSLIQQLVVHPARLSKPALTDAEKSKRSYNKRKEQDPESHKAYLAKKREANKKRRLEKKENATEEEKGIEREKAAARVAKYRAKKKAEMERLLAEGVDQSSLKKRAARPLTRKEQQKKELERKRNSERKKLEREQWSWQRKKAESLKAKERRRKRKEKELEQKCPKTRVGESCQKEASERTQASRKQALYRVRQALPTDPAYRAQTLKDLSQMLRKNELNTTVHQLMAHNRTVLRKLAQRLSTVDKQARTAGRKLLQMSCQRLHSLQKSNSFNTAVLRRSNRKEQLSRIVQDFLSDHAAPFSEKKRVTKKTGATMLLQEDMATLFKLFQRQNPQTNISKSLFYRLRPKSFKLPQLLQLNQCLCEPCANIDLKLTALKTVTNIPCSKTALIDMILCPKTGEYHSRKCLSMNCEHCGPEKLRALLSPPSKQSVQCREWINKKVVSDDKRVTTRKVLEIKEWQVEELLQKLVGEMKTYPLHLLHARWQYSAFNNMKKELKTGELMMVYDFAENFRTSYQDEVQSAHWNYQQVTIHPVVCYHTCNECNDIVTHSVVVISNDLKHDCFIVNDALMKVQKFFKERGLSFHKSMEWSDGCMAQYKSKGPFYLLQQRGKETVIHRHFFGSRHGKNPSDGESAVVKAAVSRAIKCRRAIIQDASQFYNFASRNLVKEGEKCYHFKRHFIYLDSSEVNRFDLPSLKPLPSTRLIHSVICQEGQLKYRNLTCTCEGCSDGSSPCLNREYVDQWKHHRLACQEKKSAQTPKKDVDEPTVGPDITETESAEVSISDLSGLELLSTSTAEFLEDLITGKDEHHPHGDSAIQEGQYVEVFLYGSGGSKKQFRGIVEKTFPGELLVRYMKNLGSGLYVWPEKDDSSIIPLYDVCRTLQPPSLVSRGRYRFA